MKVNIQTQTIQNANVTPKTQTNQHANVTSKTQTNQNTDVTSKKSTRSKRNRKHKNKKTSNSMHGLGQFLISWIITYLLTVFFTILVVFENFEQHMNNETSNDLLSFVVSKEPYFTFNHCEELTPLTYLSAKVVETLIPTTLTFSGSIFIMRKTRNENNYLDTALAISLFMIAMLGTFFMIVRYKSTLNIYMIALVLLISIAIVFSAMVFILQQNKKITHKNEPCDGLISGPNGES